MQVVEVTGIRVVVRFLPWPILVFVALTDEEDTDFVDCISVKF
jgi:hypothetical protein